MSEAATEDLLSEAISLELKDIAPWELQTALIRMFVQFSINTKADLSWKAIFSSFGNMSAFGGGPFSSGLILTVGLSWWFTVGASTSQETKLHSSFNTENFQKELLPE